MTKPNKLKTIKKIVKAAKLSPKRIAQATAKITKRVDWI